MDVRNTHFSLNDNIDEVVEKLGIPGKIIDTEYDFKYYIYNNNYKKLLFIAVKENRLVGYYTDSIDFDLGGISSGSSLDEVNQVLGSNYTMEEVITHHTDSYTLHILMDQAGSGLVTGIYLLDNQVSLDEYSEDVIKNVELLVYDLTNSIRARHHIPILSWSSSASNSARKHSTDMAKEDILTILIPMEKHLEIDLGKREYILLLLGRILLLVMEPLYFQPMDGLIPKPIEKLF